jgi:predicted lipoprotein with Yx(FWY)xxD motif
VNHRATRAGTILLSAGLVAAALAAPAAAAVRHPVKAKAKGTVISTTTTKLGKVLATSKRRVMYLYAKDGHNVSHCSGGCLSVWPRVTTAAKPTAAKGVLKKHLGVIKHKQVTYYGHPLYYFNGDKAGTAKGEDVGSFFAVSTHGTAVKPKKKPTTPAGPTGPAVVSTGKAGGVEVITSKNGHTLYDFSGDSPPTIGCTGSCASTWPPLLTKGAPTASGDAKSSLLGTVKRPNGTIQVTYNGDPVYDYSADTKAGQDKGQVKYAFGGYWYDMLPSGAINT